MTNNNKELKKMTDVDWILDNAYEKYKYIRKEYKHLIKQLKKRLTQIF